MTLLLVVLGTVLYLAIGVTLSINYYLGFEGGTGKLWKAVLVALGWPALFVYGLLRWLATTL